MISVLATPSDNTESHVNLPPLIGSHLSQLASYWSILRRLWTGQPRASCSCSSLIVTTIHKNGDGNAFYCVSWIILFPSKHFGRRLNIWRRQTEKMATVTWWFIDMEFDFVHFWRFKDKAKNIQSLNWPNYKSRRMVSSVTLPLKYSENVIVFEKCQLAVTLLLR